MTTEMKIIIWNIFSTLILLIFLLFPGRDQYLYAQKEKCNYSLRGIISSADDNEPIGYANIFVNELNRGEVSDDNGNFTIKGLCAGKYRLTISCMSYRTVDTVITIPYKGKISIYMHKGAYDINEITVEDKKPEEEITITKKTLGSADLDASRGKTLGETITAFPGVSVINTGGRTSKPSIHGLHSNRILVLYNGVRLEGQQWKLDYAPEIDPFVASKITVVQGASSVRYGSDAMGGVILVDPPDLRYDPGIEGEVNLVGFSNDKQGILSATAGGNFNRIPGFSWRLQGTLKRGGNAKTPDYYLNNTGIKEQNFTYALGYNKEKYGAELFYSQYNAIYGFYRDSHFHTILDLLHVIETGEINDSLDFTYDLVRPRKDIGHELFKSKVFVKTGNNTQLNITYSRQFNRHDDYYVYCAYDTIPENSPPDISFKLTAHTINLDWEHRHSSGIKGITGVDFSHLKSTINNPAYLPKHTDVSYGIYWIESWKHKDLMLEAGLRYDYEKYFLKRRSDTDTIPEELDFQNVSVSLGANYTLFEDLKINLNYGIAWRPPSIHEMFINGVELEDVSIYIGNPGFEPERVYNIVGGVQYFDSTTVDLAIGAYYKKFDSYIFTAPGDETMHTINGFFPVIRFRQAEATIQGIDGHIDFYILRFLSLGIKGSLIRGYNHTIDEYLPLIPPDQIEFNIKYQLKKEYPRIKDVYFMPAYEYNDKQIRVGIDYAPEYFSSPEGYYLLNFEGGATVIFGKQKIIMGFSINNALNTVYRAYLNRLRFFVDDMGRNFSLRVKIPLEFAPPKGE